MPAGTDVVPIDAVASRYSGEEAAQFAQNVFELLRAKGTEPFEN
jgi:hypothetical protein